MNKKVLIVGAGITGLALAAILEKSGKVDVTLIDNAARIKQKGYGITIMPGGLEVIRSLKLITKLRSVGTVARRAKIIDAKGVTRNIIGLGDSGIDSVTLDREDLHSLLASQLRKTRIRLRTTVKKLTSKEHSVTVTFNDKTTGVYDLVVGADGVHSIVRSLIFPLHSAKKVGAAIWSMMLPKNFRLKDNKTVLSIWGTKRFMGIFPVQKGGSATFGMPYDTSKRPSEVNVYDAFSDLSPLAHDVLTHTRARDIYSSHLREIKLKHWYKSNIVLAGDAAHTMMPATGMGASIGLQDAKALADLIISSKVSELNTVPFAYEARRKKLAEKVQKEAFIVGKMMLANNVGARVRDFLISKIPSHLITRNMKNSG
jgi:2-polyprenyl-6-methoxyphenol hydroxylase-like FAD-dependent oxidoreductase